MGCMDLSISKCNDCLYIVFSSLSEFPFSLFQPILVFMSKVDGKFMFSPISVNFLTEVAKVLFAIVMLLFQVRLLLVCFYLFLRVSLFVLFLEYMVKW